MMSSTVTTNTWSSTLYIGAPATHYVVYNTGRVNYLPDGGVDLVTCVR